MGESPSRLAAAVAVATGLTLTMSVTPADATVMEPPGEAFEATNGGPVILVTNNGNGISFSCNVSTFEGVIPGGPNDNPDGSVFGRLTDIVYDECTESFLGTSFDVDTTPEEGAWSFSAIALEDGSGNETEDLFTIAAPPAGIEIDLPILSCTMTLPQAGATPVGAAVTGDWEDGTDSTNDPSKLSIDEQLPFDGCGLTSPGVYFGFYEVRSLDSNDPVTINES